MANAKKVLILLCGFSGAGKTTLIDRFTRWRSVANSHGQSWTILDSDFCIEKELIKTQTLSQFIEDKGIEAFRSLEQEWLEWHFFESIAATTCHKVIALGGGGLGPHTLPLWHDFNKYCCLLKNFKSILVCLDTPFEVCWQRVKKDLLRPLVVMKGYEGMKDLYDQRQEFYRQADRFLTPEQQNLIHSPLDLLK